MQQSIKYLKVKIDNLDENSLVAKILKLGKENFVTKALDSNAYKVFSNKIKATIFFEKIETAADKELKEAQIKDLKASIERREKLLSNENYVNKAPAKIVELDRQKLAEEKQKLEELLK